MSRPESCPWCGQKINGFYGGWFEGPPHDCPTPNKVELAQRRQVEVRIKAQTIVAEDFKSGELFWQIFGRYILAATIEGGDG